MVTAHKMDLRFNDFLAFIVYLEFHSKGKELIVIISISMLGDCVVCIVKAKPTSMHNEVVWFCNIVFPCDGSY